VPRVTVIIPTYNWSTVLPYSIGSVLRQTFTDFDLLVIGDACTDDSEKVVTATPDPRVRWINLPANVGHQSGPNNEGIRQARGEIIAYLGHDDLWLPHHLSKMTAALDRGADLAYGIVEMVGVDGSVPKPAPREMEHYVSGMWIPPSGVIHRRQAILDVGGWPHFVDVDREPEAVLWERMHLTGSRIAFVSSLVAIKFPASVRRDVYKIRPAHEQAAWTARIDSEPEFHMTELVRMLSGAVGVPKASKPFTMVLGEFLSDFRLRVRRRVFGPPKIVHLTRSQVFNQRRRFKGLDEKASRGS